VVKTFCKWIAAFRKRGRDHLEALRKAHRAESDRLPGVFGEVLAAVREAGTDAAPPEGAGAGREVGGHRSGGEGGSSAAVGPRFRLISNLS
jgi:hypothetical protein